MTEYTFQVTLIASIRVKAETAADAEHKLREALAASDANLGMLDDEPIVVTVEIEGDLDLIDAVESACGGTPRVLSLTHSQPDAATAASIGG
jgi:hypothetical protein